MVRIMRDVAGVEDISRVDSWRVWRSETDNFIQVNEKVEPYRLSFDTNEVVPLEQMDTRGSPELEDAIQSAQEFADNLSFWMLILGPRGVGKSNILKALAMDIGPMALYLSTRYFKHKLYQADNIAEMIDAIRKVPVLLIDDLGFEYCGGNHRSSPFAQAKMRGIINHRYNLREEFPTVVASNLTPRELLAHEPRIGSRLLDYRARKFVLKRLSDYRKRGR